MKKIDRKRYTKERTVSGKTEVYDSYSNQWLMMSLILNDSSVCHSSPSFSGGSGEFGGGGATSSYSDCSSSCDSGGSSGGCD